MSLYASIDRYIIEDTRYLVFFFFSSRRRHTRLQGDWSSDVCSSDLEALQISDAVREAIAADRPLPDVHNVARESRSLVPFADYARHLLQKQIISASEVLLSLAD